MHAPTPITKSYAQIKATKRMRWWYEHLADYMIAHPKALQNDIAAHFGKSPGTISVIVNSDAFKAYLRQRRANYVEALDSSVREKMLNVADVGFDLILDRFDKKRDTIPLETLNRTIELALKGSGMGQTPGAGTVVNVNAPSQTTVVPVPVSLSDLQEAQQALRNAQQGITPTASPVVEGEYTEVDEAPTESSIEDLA